MRSDDIPHNGGFPAEPALAKMLVAAINEHEADLGKVSRLLHDEVSQILSAVGLQLDALRMDFAAEAPSIEQRAAEIQGMLEQAISQLRDISNEFSPSLAERAGLPFAIERLAERTRKNFAGQVRVRLDPSARVPTPVARAFSKIAECAVNRAASSPGCTAIDISLQRTAGEFVLQVHSNAAVPESDPKGISLDRLFMDYHASQNEVTLLETAGSQGQGSVVRASHAVPGAERRS